MNVPVRERDLKAGQRLGVIDCDIHPSIRDPQDLKQFLPARWRNHYDEYGLRSREPLDAIVYPRMTPALSRVDSWPPAGGAPGTDLDFMRQQHLDANNVEAGILIPLATKAGEQRNLDFSNALCHALNDWQIKYWLEPEPRLHGSIVITPEDPEGAAAEIDARASNPRFVQVLLQPRSGEPLGHKRYWPIYEAAVRAGRPLGSHIGGQGGYPVTGSGWPSYYFEDHHANVWAMQSFIASLVIEGVFEQFPDLKVVLTEPGFAWVPAFCWRMDKQWQRFRDEVPHLTRKPSEYVRENIWFTTQPIEEPERPEDLARIIDWIGADRLMFATDYPHWDFDDPRYVFGNTVSREVQQKIFRDNARKLYRLD